MLFFMITSGHWHSPLGRGPSALLCPGAYNAVKTALITLVISISLDAQQLSGVMTIPVHGHQKQYGRSFSLVSKTG